MCRENDAARSDGTVRPVRRGVNSVANGTIKFKREYQQKSLISVRRRFLFFSSSHRLKLTFFLADERRRYKYALFLSTAPSPSLSPRFTFFFTLSPCPLCSLPYLATAGGGAEDDILRIGIAYGRGIRKMRIHRESHRNAYVASVDQFEYETLFNLLKLVWQIRSGTANKYK